MAFAFYTSCSEEFLSFRVGFVIRRIEAFQGIPGNSSFDRILVWTDALEVITAVAWASISFFSYNSMESRRTLNRFAES